jgi:hypothetical protein
MMFFISISGDLLELVVLKKNGTDACFVSVQEERSLINANFVHFQANHDQIINPLSDICGCPFFFPCLPA